MTCYAQGRLLHHVRKKTSTGERGALVPHVTGSPHLPRELDRAKIQIVQDKPTRIPRAPQRSVRSGSGKRGDHVAVPAAHKREPAPLQPAQPGTTSIAKMMMAPVQKPNPVLTPRPALHLPLVILVSVQNPYAESDHTNKLQPDATPEIRKIVVQLGTHIFKNPAKVHHFVFNVQ